MEKKNKGKKAALGKEPSWDQIGKAIGMKIEKGCKSDECVPWNIKKHVHKQGCGGALYGMGFIGALVYYISTATSFWMGALGILKAIAWPAFLVYELLRFLGI
ncbi:hypothetical protein JW949_01970 [Candidatus Woesearchaeota archaeon]|nr:hypothetical protein [Candidatus Woesearchaeota archaeon]